MNIFSFDVRPNMLLDEFRALQESTISQLMSFVKNVFLPGMISIIKTNLSEVGKGWFNLQETNRESYNMGKLKKFMTLVRI
jgi:dynein heavy chain, axonemal